MEFSGDIQFCSVYTPYATKKQNQRIRWSFRSLLISRAFVAFYLSPLSHEWATCDLNLWECVFNSLTLAVWFLFFFYDSVPQYPLPWGNWGLRAKISKAVCASVAVVISVRKDGDGIWWDLEQCESLLPRNPREDFRQNWNSHHARGVVAYSISQTRKPSCVQLGGILLSTWSLSTSFGFSKPDCLDIKPIYKPHYCSNHMALTQRYSL